MRGHSDEQLAERMLWKLSRDPGTFAAAYLFSKHDYRFPASLAGCEGMGDLGVPVFALIGVDGWTVFGTAKIISSYQGKLAEVEIDAIREIDYPQAGAVSKVELDMVELVQDDEGKRRIWTGKGFSFGTIAGLLVMLQRMQKKK